MQSRAKLIFPVVETGKVYCAGQRKQYPMMHLKKRLRNLFHHLYNRDTPDWWMMEFYPNALEGLMRIRKLAKHQVPYFILTFHDGKQGKEKR